MATKPTTKPKPIKALRKGDGFLYKIKTHYFTMIKEFSDQAHFDKLILKELQKYS